MTTIRTIPAGTRRSTVLPGIAALIGLIALLVLPPLGLALTVGNPVPQHLVIDGRFTDAAVIGLLAGIVWLAWAQLVVVIVIEAAAAIRGRGLPRVLPGCGLQQHLARRLVVTASVLLAGLGATGTVTASAAPATAAVTSFAATAASPAPNTPVGPEVTFRQAPVPSNPTNLAASQTMASAHAADRRAELWYVVQPPRGHHHDSLWDIAERHLGDGLRWREIYDLNRHHRQADGQRLELARLIQPGWRLLMPADATGIPAKSPTPLPEAPVAPTPASDGGAPSAPGATQHQQTPTVGAIESTVPTSQSAVAALGTGRVPNARNALADARFAAEAPGDEPAVPFGTLTLGLSAIACAGAVAELTRRRRRAQRSRRPGERLPKPDPAAASAERLVRTANAELGVTALRDLLRDLAHTCRANSRSLPDVQAIRLNAAGVTLLLGAEDPDPVAPFTKVDDRAWTVSADALPPRSEDTDRDYTDPYPALVALGVDDDAVLLLNLESAGTLSIVGDPEETRPILHALILELGTSELTATAHLVLTDCPAELLDMLDRGRVTAMPTAEASRWATQRQSDVDTLLNAAGVPDLATARLAELADDAWAPAVLLRGEPTDVAGDGPGVASVRLARDTHSAEGWALARDGNGWRLDPVGLAITPQRLTADAALSLGTALATAAEPPTTPAAPIPVVEEEALTATVVALRRDGIATVPAARLPEPRRAVEEATPFPSPAPRVLVLGPVEILGVPDDGAPGRRRRATELIAYLALHPGATQHQLDEALWPGCRVSRNTRNPLVSRSRQWLGTNPDGQPYLGLVADEGKYNLAADVTCDWDDFQALADSGIAAGDSGLDDLEAALRLVRGRPFLGVNPAAYGWAEVHTQDMISAVVDVAEALATTALQVGDFRRASWAAARGLGIEPLAEGLSALAVDAAAASGNREEAERLATRFAEAVRQLDPEDEAAPQRGIRLRMMSRSSF